MAKRRTAEGTHARYLLAILMLATTLLLSGSVASCGSEQSGKGISAGQYPRDSGVLKEAGIQNCHGYTWWQLTGKPPRSKSMLDLTKELERRGYKGWVIPSMQPISLKRGDVVTIEGHGVSHSGFSLHDGTLSHLRSTTMQKIVRPHDNLPANMKVGGLEERPGVFVIANPYALSDYPRDFESWLVAQSSLPEVTRVEIDKKKKDLSIGFWHERDTLDEVKRLLYPDVSPTITVWKLPRTLEIDPKQSTMSKEGEKALVAWLHFDPEMDRVEASNHKDITVLWSEPGQPETIKNGVVKATDVTMGANVVKASVKIITPWCMMPEPSKSDSIGKDVEKWLKAEAVLTVTDDPPEPTEPPKETYIPLGCMDAVTREEKAECMFAFVLVEGKPIDEIGRITDTELRDWGYYWYVRKGGNNLLCDLIEDPEIKKWCLEP